MIYPIAIRLYDSPGGFIRIGKKYPLELTAGSGVKFYVNGLRVYGSTDPNEVGKPYHYWHYMDAAEYRKNYDYRNFRALCVYGDYLYGFQNWTGSSSGMASIEFASVMFAPNHAKSVPYHVLETLFAWNHPLTPDDIEHIYDALDEPCSVPLNTDITSDECTASCAASVDSNGIIASLQSIPDSNKKENKNMNFNISNSLLKNLRCGKAGSGFGISLFDGSISYKGHSYNGSALVETAGFEIEAGDFLFIMPTTEIKKGDIVALANDVAFYDGANFISLTTGAKTEYVPISCFGMTFYSVVRNMLGNLAGNGGNAMNNLLPLMLLDKDGDSDDLMKMMLLMNGGLNFNFGAANNSSAKTE